MTGRWAGFFVLLVAAVKLVAAPPEPIQKPVKLLGLGENVDREFAKLTDIGITPSLTYYGVFQGNPVGGIQQRTAYSQLILFMLPKIRTKLVLAPIDRAIEVLAGVIMVLTFTNALSVSHAGKPDVRAMLIGSLGCNLAWGIIDGIMYLMNCLAARGHKLDAFRALRAANDPEAQRILTAELPEELAGELGSVELAPIIRRLRELPEPPPRPWLSLDEWLGSLRIGLVFCSTLPVVLPFLLVSNTTFALRISNLVAVGLLFLTGYLFGQHTGHNPWRWGIAMVFIGCLLTAVAFSLGG